MLMERLLFFYIIRYNYLSENILNCKIWGGSIVGCNQNSKIVEISEKLIRCNSLKLFKLELEKISMESLDIEIKMLENQLITLKSPRV